MTFGGVGGDIYDAFDGKITGLRALSKTWMMVSELCSETDGLISGTMSEEQYMKFLITIRRTPMILSKD